jgi:hypothetical protein
LRYLLALVPASASAEEPAVHLKQAPGVDVVEGRCAACHSLDYVIINSPFLSNESGTLTASQAIGSQYLTLGKPQPFITAA